MPIQLIAPLYKTFTLEESDKKYNPDGPPTQVTIRQATQAQHRERQDLFATLERRFSDDKPNEVSLIQTLSFEELKESEIWLTMVECNLLDESGAFLFPSRKLDNGHTQLAMNKRQFIEALGKIYQDVVAEIHAKVLLVNPLWRGPEGEG